MRRKVSIVLLVVGIGLLASTAVFPVEKQLEHTTTSASDANESQLRAQGFEIVHYENLSQRGQKLYITTLKNDGEYRVAAGEGAPEFQYPTVETIRETKQEEGRYTEHIVIVERPANGDLPASNEPNRFDRLVTKKVDPPLLSPPNLRLYLSLILGIVSIATGGYMYTNDR